MQGRFHLPKNSSMADSLQKLLHKPAKMVVPPALVNDIRASMSDLIFLSITDGSKRMTTEIDPSLRVFVVVSRSVWLIKSALERRVLRKSL